MDSPQLNLGCAFTLSAWVRTDSVKSQIIMVKGGAVNGLMAAPFGLSMSQTSDAGTNDIIFSIRAEGVLFQARKQGYAVDTWYLVTGVFDNGRMKLYVNGTLGATNQVSGKLVNETAPLLIGTRLQLPSSTFEGVIDDWIFRSS